MYQEKYINLNPRLEKFAHCILSIGGSAHREHRPGGGGGEEIMMEEGN